MKIGSFVLLQVFSTNSLELVKEKWSSYKNKCLNYLNTTPPATGESHFSPAWVQRRNVEQVWQIWSPLKGWCATGHLTSMPAGLMDSREPLSTSPAHGSCHGYIKVCMCLCVYNMFLYNLLIHLSRIENKREWELYWEIAHWCKNCVKGFNTEQHTSLQKLSKSSWGQRKKNFQPYDQKTFWLLYKAHCSTCIVFNICWVF